MLAGGLGGKALRALETPGAEERAPISAPAIPPFAPLGSDSFSSFSSAILVTWFIGGGVVNPEGLGAGIALTGAVALKGGAPVVEGVDGALGVAVAVEALRMAQGKG